MANGTIIPNQPYYRKDDTVSLTRGSYNVGFCYQNAGVNNFSFFIPLSKPIYATGASISIENTFNIVSPTGLISVSNATIDSVAVRDNGIQVTGHGTFSATITDFTTCEIAAVMTLTFT